MKKFIGCAFMPHSPRMIPEIGKADFNSIQIMADAVAQIAKKLKEFNPQTLILISPHGPVAEEAVGISVHPRLKGNLADFGAPEVSVGFETDSLLTRHIIKQAKRLGVDLLELTEAGGKNCCVPPALDYGAVVPLYFLYKAGFKGQLVHLSVGLVSYEEVYTFGKAVQAAINSVDKRVAVIASGNLSHRLTPESPDGYSPRASEFDQSFMQVLKTFQVKDVFNMDKALIIEAGECALRPLCFLFGVLGGIETAAPTLTYEQAAGAGYVAGLFLSQEFLRETTGSNE